MTKKREAMTLPLIPLIGVEADMWTHAVARWADAGYDIRLFPHVYPDDATQRSYDLYDAWCNMGYEDHSEYWPLRDLTGKLHHGVDTHGKPAVSKRGADGYVPTTRSGAWGVGGELDRELAERGTLGVRYPPKTAKPGQPRPAR